MYGGSERNQGKFNKGNDEQATDIELAWASRGIAMEEVSTTKSNKSE